MDTAIVAGIGLAMAGAGTAAQMITSSKAQEAQDEAYEAQKKQVAVENARAENANYAQQLQNIRRGRIARAAALASGISAGAEEGSGVAGAVGSIGSQTAYNVGTLATDINLAKQSAAYGTEAAGHLSDASRWNSYGSMFGAAGGLGASMFGAAGGFKAFKNPAETQPVEISSSNRLVAGGFKAFGTNSPRYNFQYRPTTFF